MTKLQRAVDSQTIQFLALPRIFNSLSGDLPSGKVVLPNGEVAYWRLHRNLTELKKQRKNTKDLAVKLAQAFKALVSSDAFLNHYGLAKAPSIESENQLTATFRALLGLNNNRVDYNTIHHGRQKPLLETLIVPLGNLTFFNAYRGIQEPPKVDGAIKGKLWLKDGSGEDQCFNFNIVSPVVKLADFMSADRLTSEILTKIKQNMPLIAHNPKIVFADGQFDNYVGRGLQDLAEKHNGAGGNGKQKKQSKKQEAVPAGDTEVVQVTLTSALTKEAFEALTEEQKVDYLNVWAAVVEQKFAEAKDDLAAFLLSGILGDQLAAHNEAAKDPVTHPFYLAIVIGMNDVQFTEVMGDNEPLLVQEVTDTIDASIAG